MELFATIIIQDSKNDLTLQKAQKIKKIFAFLTKLLVAGIVQNHKSIVKMTKTTFDFCEKSTEESP